MILEVSKPQELVVFGLESGLVGTIQLKSCKLNWISSDDEAIGDNIKNLISFNDLEVQSKPKSNGLNLQFHEALNEMTITAITISDAKRCFYVGTSEGVVSCFLYTVNIPLLFNLDIPIVEIFNVFNYVCSSFNY